MLWRCLGCTYSSDTLRGLANHQRRCRAHKSVAANALCARLGDLRLNEQEDRAEQAAAQRLAEEPIEMEVDVTVGLEQADVGLH
jgi:hypothetical protein